VAARGFATETSGRRDELLAWTLFDAAAVVIPSAAALFALFPASHALGAAFLVATRVLFLQRIMLALHYSAHRPLFRRETLTGQLLGRAPDLVLSPLFGVPPGLYHLHHVNMHHSESNGSAWDVSSTEPFQRDNPAHFLVYWLRFVVLLWFELPAYAWRRGRHAQALRATAGEIAYLASVFLLWKHVAPVATLYVFILPFFITSLALCFGNWSQHILIDKKSAKTPAGLAYNAINCDDNARSFNDGYHLLHHLNARWHWSELPSKFREEQVLRTLAKSDAITFQGVGFFDIGVMVFARQLRTLVRKHLVVLPGQPQRSEDEWVAVLKDRLKPVR